MFEVIYISPSCKQSANFIYDLVEKLKQNGVSNFEVDMKHLQIKSDKFIVSSVDILGGMLGRGYSKVKYYINRAYTATFSGYKVQEKITCALKDIKIRFPKDAKEISEEELIEILTEVSV